MSVHRRDAEGAKIFKIQPQRRKGHRELNKKPNRKDAKFAKENQYNNVRIQDALNETICVV
jgi:hypothetical protein